MDKVLNILTTRFRHHPHSGQAEDYYQEIDDRGIWGKIQDEPRVWPDSRSFFHNKARQWGKDLEFSKYVSQYMGYYADVKLYPETEEYKNAVQGDWEKEIWTTGKNTTGRTIFPGDMVFTTGVPFESAKVDDEKLKKMNDILNQFLKRNRDETSRF